MFICTCIDKYPIFLFLAFIVANVCQKMDILKVDILSLSETRYPYAGLLTTRHKTFYYTGNNDTEHPGVGIILREELYKTFINSQTDSSLYNFQEHLSS